MTTPLNRHTLLDRGFTSEVYEWGPQRILKLFLPGSQISKAQDEFAAMQAVHALGLPVPTAYEVVEVESRPGIVMEQVIGVSLLQHVQSRPWTMMAAVRQLAELHARVNSCAAPETLPRQRGRIASRIEAASCLTDGEKQSALNCLAELSEGSSLCHGDFHPGNIIVTANGPVIIDWDGAARGHPAADVAATLLLMERANLPSWTPRYMHWLLGATRSLIRRSYLNLYLRSNLATRDEIDAWYRPVAFEFRCRIDPATPSADRQ